jgi:hypothetical protein
MDLMLVHIIFFVSMYQNCTVQILLIAKLHITESCRLLKLQEIWGFQS